MNERAFVIAGDQAAVIANDTNDARYRAAVHYVPVGVQVPVRSHGDAETQFMLITHGDDAGTVIPPKLAPIQVVVVPIFYGEEEKGVVMVPPTMWAPGGRRGRWGANKNPLRFRERAGVWFMNAQIYPVAPMAVARLMSLATGRSMAFMAVLLCTSMNVSSAAPPLTCAPSER